MPKPGLHLASETGENTSSAEFAALFARLRLAVVKFFARRTSDHALAEELTQELFLRLLRHPDIFTLENIDGYVFQSAINLARDHARRSSARGPVTHVELETFQIRAGDPDAEETLDSRQRLNGLLDAIEALPPRTRRVLILSRFENMTYVQISLRLGISVSAVEKQVSKALYALRAWR